MKLTNPSTKALNYAVTIIGDDAINFTLPKGNSITIQPKHSTQLTIAFHNVFLRSNHATLILTGRRLNAGLGTNIAFSLVTETSKIIPQVRSFLWKKKMFSFFYFSVAKYKQFHLTKLKCCFFVLFCLFLFLKQEYCKFKKCIKI